MLKVLDEFFVLSGLGINKPRIQLYIFGCTLMKSELAMSLKLKRCSEFTLLGINFDQCMENMDNILIF